MTLASTFHSQRFRRHFVVIFSRRSKASHPPPQMTGGARQFGQSNRPLHLLAVNSLFLPDSLRAVDALASNVLSMGVLHREVQVRRNPVQIASQPRPRHEATVQKWSHKRAHPCTRSKQQLRQSCCRATKPSLRLIGLYICRSCRPQSGRSTTSARPKCCVTQRKC